MALQRLGTVEQEYELYVQAASSAFKSEATYPGTSEQEFTNTRNSIVRAKAQMIICDERLRLAVRKELKIGKA